MYRYLKYEGHWEEGVKEGHGVLYFVNEDSITGTFEHGQPHGIIKVIFNKKKRVRWANYVRGTRVSWVDQGSALEKAQASIKGLHTATLVKQNNVEQILL